MSKNSLFTRREFLGGSLAVVSAAATMPMFLERSAYAADASRGKPGSADDRILVVVQLSGGNDGLNAVVPYGMADYYRARPRMAVEEKNVLKLAKVDGIGLNPEMADLKAMIEEGQASIVQGVGYPNPNRSHFTSMDIWHTADPNGGRGFGWIGKALDEARASAGGKLDATACVCIMQDTPLAANGRVVKPIAFERANLFRWTGGDLHPALAKEYDKLNRAGVLDVQGVRTEGPADQAAFIMRTALDAQVASDKIRTAVGNAGGGGFPGNQLGNHLRMVAAMIRAELPTRVYYVSLGGFDTHAGQPDRHGRLLREFTSAVRAFHTELKSIGQQERVLTFAFSEFGRRVAQNASNGTDHGTAGPVFLFGPMVRPGVLGEHPSLADLDKGDLIHNADFRSVYAGILQNWMKIDSTKVLGKEFKPAEVIAAKATA